MNSLNKKYEEVKRHAGGVPVTREQAEGAIEWPLKIHI